ncbi:hypothetical protein PAXRUDRAFT_763715 [Paxillus rubicundulus Ve08.2h10]|uniref:Uncharacterized protein n=1 Tax=Paxillus rubicundulus Ve08.2h10 TaxID=930991 RepID=A0A0D0CZB4_9AGAM|nr:hypothetical protein PAXRUDRAFT_763715 [Paxillus rubicundulus Ve08.2h10]
MNPDTFHFTSESQEFGSTGSFISSAPGTQSLVLALVRNGFCSNIPLPQFTFTVVPSGICSESQLQDDYNYSLLPPLPPYAPVAVVSHSIGPLAGFTRKATLPLLTSNEKEHLVKEATSAAYLALHQRGALDTQINSTNSWELHCPAGCWVKIRICSHIPLTTKGQFTTLEGHWAKKSCKANSTRVMIEDSHAALATVFPNSLIPSSLSLPLDSALALTSFGDTM